MVRIKGDFSNLVEKSSDFLLGEGEVFIPQDEGFLPHLEVLKFQGKGRNLSGQHDDSNIRGGILYKGLEKLKCMGNRGKAIQTIHDDVNRVGDLLKNGLRPLTKRRNFGSRFNGAHGIGQEIIKIDIL